MLLEIGVEVLLALGARAYCSGMSFVDLGLLGRLQQVLSESGPHDC